MKRINTPLYVDDARPQALLTQQRLHPPYQQIINKYREATGFQMLSSAQMAKKLGIGISTGWLRTQQKLIPPPIKLSERSVRWVEREIDALLEAQVLASRS
jgi:prophage regulatory protein